MRLPALSRTLLPAVFLLGTAASTLAQAYGGGLGGDAALTYHWVRTNEPVANCGCIDLNGAGLSASLNFAPQLAAVAEIASETASKVNSTTSSLTLTSYMAGARYRVPMRSPRGLQPFAQILVGGGHAGGGAAAAGDKSYSFVSRVGGGIDLPLGPHFAIRLLQADYYLSTFNNSSNNRQNNLLLGAGVVVRWTHQK